MRSYSLSFKLIAGGITAVALPLIVVGTFAVVKSTGAMKTAANNDVVHIAQNLSSMTEVALNQEMKNTNGYSVNGNVVEALTAYLEKGESGASSELTALNIQLKKLNDMVGENYESILVANEKGVVIADGNSGQNVGLSLSEREYFQTAVKGRANIGEAVKSKISGKPILPFASPIIAKNGSIAGVFVTVLDINFLSKIIVDVKVGQTGYPFVVDEDGSTVVHPVEEHILETNLGSIPEMSNFIGRMTRQETGVDEYTFEGIHKIAGFAPIPVVNWSIGVTQPSSEFMGAVKAIRNIILLVAAIFLGVTVTIVVLFARGITNSINSVINNLTEGSAQVSAASSEVSASSQQLAESSSEQAASIEEISSSLEEIASMTKQNAQNANEAMNGSLDTRKSAEKGAVTMEDMVKAIDEIKTSSDETAKIIKTIDEIAFQTNLLALNAAVEAARAGEAGAGFAVVAEEVRNLALRSAEAAKNTSDLIEQSQRNADNGVTVTRDVASILEEIVEASKKVAQVSSEVSNATDEQVQGIDQVNKAVEMMDTSTQTIAANAEESASSSEELNAQATELNTMVNVLIGIVGGNSVDVSSQTRLSAPKLTHKAKSLVPKINRKPVSSRASSQLVKPEEVIPLDDNDFESF